MAGAAVAGLFFAAGSTAYVVAAAAINFAVAFAASYLVAKAAMRGMGGAVSSADLKQTLQSDKAAQRVVYGERQLSMVMNFAEEQNGLQEIDNETGESHERLYMTGMICNHPVYEIGDVYLDDKLLSKYGSDWATISHVNGTGQIPSFLLEKTAQYEPTMTGSNGYWIAVSLIHNTEIFSGIPSPKVNVKGKVVKDFRTGQMVYSNNAALVIADFYINYMNVPEERLMMSGQGSFIAAANLCDEQLEHGKRYEINGVFDLSSKPSGILNEMLLSCGGTLVRVGGQIGLLPAAYYGEGVQNFTIEESDIVGEISITPQEALGECANIMQGTYIEPTDDWSEQDFTPIRDEAAILRDGFEVTEDIDYQFVTNSDQAQRLSHIELNRRLAGGFTEVTLNPKGAACRVGRVVTLNLPQVGLTGEFRVTNQKENSDLTFTISMQREDQSIYDDAIGVPYTPPPLLDLGGGDIAPPTGLQFVYTATDNDGNIVQGALTWINNSASTSYFNVLILDENDEIVQSGDTKGYVYNVNALGIGTYKGKVRSVDSRGKASAYSVTTFSVGEPKIPADWRDGKVNSDGGTYSIYNRSNWNVELIPNIEGGVPKGTEFEFWHIADSESYLTGQPTYDESNLGLAALVATGSSYNQGGLTPDRWQHYWVRSVNSYGKSDFIYLQTGTSKEQDLVTTVVEKLKAIEVESQNWEPKNTGISDFGYKLYSPASDPVTMPDGTQLQNPDGLAVFQNIVANGHITAKSLTFVSDDAIPDEINNENAVQEANEYANQNFVDAVTYGADIAEIQAQLDKSITSWFGDDTPTANNYPAVDWTTAELKDQHLGDLYYDNDDGLSYRWSLDKGTYLWIRVVDSGIEAALAAAAAAQDTADSKRRVFFATPVPPYDRGDLWDTGNGIRRADVTSSTTFQDSHWVWSSDAAGAANNAEMAAKNHADAAINAEQVRADAYADGVADQAEQAAIREAEAAAQLAEFNSKAYADGEISESEMQTKAAYEAYADATSELAQVTAEAYADGIVSEEEARAIADAQAKADQAEANAKAASDPKGSADAALQAANAHADAQANLAQVTAEAYADGVADDAELKAIAEAQKLADEAEAAAKAASDPKGSASAAQQAAEAHATAEAELAKTTAEAYADGIVSEEEARAIADAQAKADAAEANAKVYADYQLNTNRLPIEYTNATTESSPDFVSGGSALLSAGWSDNTPNGDARGVGSMRITTSGDGTEGYVLFGKEVSDYNVPVVRNKKHVVSADIYSEITGAAQFYLKTSSGQFKSGSITLQGGVWSRYYVTIDLADTDSDYALFRVDNDMTNNTIYINNMQVEEYKGVPEPSAYTAGYAPTQKDVDDSSKDAVEQADQNRNDWGNVTADLQISGGGFKDNQNQGYGIYSNGYAVFTSGMNVNQGTIYGGTIYGATIIQDSLFFAVDADGDGNVNGAEYYTGFENNSDYIVKADEYVVGSSDSALCYEYHTVNFTFSLVPAYDRNVPVTQRRFKQTPLPEGTFNIKNTESKSSTGSGTQWQFRYTFLDRDLNGEVWKSDWIGEFIHDAATPGNGLIRTHTLQGGFEFEWNFSYNTGAGNVVELYGKNLKSPYGWSGMSAVGGLKVEVRLSDTISGSGIWFKQTQEDIDNTLWIEE